MPRGIDCLRTTNGIRKKRSGPRSLFMEKAKRRRSSEIMNRVVNDIKIDCADDSGSSSLSWSWHSTNSDDESSPPTETNISVNILASFPPCSVPQLRRSTPSSRETVPSTALTVNGTVAAPCSLRGLRFYPICQRTLQWIRQHCDPLSDWKSNDHFETHRKLYTPAFDITPAVKSFKPHECSSECLPVNDDPLLYKGANPLLIPIVCGWERHILMHFRLVKVNKDIRSCLYRAPCGRSLRSIKEVFRYLRLTGSHLTPDLFSFDITVRLFRKMRQRKEDVVIPDVSYGEENVEITCVNQIGNDKPKSFRYCVARYSTDLRVNLADARLFLSGCDCEDDCSDPKKCACQMLTTLQNEGKSYDGPSKGYSYRRLRASEPVICGIYECNHLCKCSNRCNNRVIQQPLMNPLQVFKTKNKGWGIRTLYDIPRGAFICTYAGDVLSDHRANKIGRCFGDEYFAELDLLLTAQNCKEGYDPSFENFYPLAVSRSGKSSARCRSSSKRPAFPPPASDCRADSDSDRSIVILGVTTKGRHHEELQNDKRLCSSSVAVTATYSNPTTTVGSTASDQASKPWTPLDHFGDKDALFTVDTKISGNVGRYFNHSCNPNIFVQSVFVDTHDLRLPWVAFFARRFIFAGEELCWDYNYVPGSVPGKQINCNCGSTSCRKRLL